MVNWHDPVILEEDYVAVIKLDHVVAGIYIWETVVTAGFELDILRGKLPYRRTIWLYLGTRYSGLFVFIMVVIRMDGPAKLSCQASIAIDALANASWVFASILFALRVIAIWDRNVFVTSLVIGTWLAGLALNIYSLTGLRGPYNSTLETCLSFDNRKYLINTAGLVAIDVILIATMLIGLLRWCRGSSTGLWRLLYQQCIIWLVLAAIAEIPVITLLILNFNKAMNEAFTGVAVAIMTIGATRMHRSLFQHAYPTEIVSSKLPQDTLGIPDPNPRHRAANVYSSIHFASGAQSNGTVTTNTASEVMQTDHVQFGFTHGASIPSLVDENVEAKIGYQMA